MAFHVLRLETMESYWVKTIEDHFVDYLCSFIGSRYQWAGEGGYNKGFDCSGLVLEGFRAFGLWGKADATSQGIYDKFKSWEIQESVRKGDIVFFGKDSKSITHVAVAIDSSRMIEAGGGDSKSVDEGFVRIRPFGWRKDMVAIVRPRWF